MKTDSMPVRPHTIFLRLNVISGNPERGNNVYGVIGIPLQKETLDTFEYSILLSVINECALSKWKIAKNDIRKEKNSSYGQK